MIEDDEKPDWAHSHLPDQIREGATRAEQRQDCCQTERACHQVIDTLNVKTGDGLERDQLTPPRLLPDSIQKQEMKPAAGAGTFGQRRSKRQKSATSSHS
jgi:hypothetical protein